MAGGNKGVVGAMPAVGVLVAGVISAAAAVAAPPAEPERDGHARPSSSAIHTYINVYIFRNM